MMVGEWLFAAPWWLLATAGAAAAALVAYGLAKPASRLRRISLIAVLVLVAWVVAGILVQTPTERAVSRTTALVRAYEAADWKRLTELIDDETRFDGMLVGQEIVEAAKLTHEAIGQHPITISQVASRADDLGVVVSLRIRSESSQSVHPFSTAWKFDYRRLGEQWRLDRIEFVPTEGSDASLVRRNVRMPARTLSR